MVTYNIELEFQEIEVLVHLMKKMIELGTDVETVRMYLEIYDKLDKTVRRK